MISPIPGGPQQTPRSLLRLRHVGVRLHGPCGFAGAAVGGHLGDAAGLGLQLFGRWTTGAGDV